MQSGSSADDAGEAADGRSPRRPVGGGGGEKKKKNTKEAAESLTLAVDCNSCRTTRRLCLCSSHRSPGGERGRGKGWGEGEEKGSEVQREACS